MIKKLFIAVIILYFFPYNSIAQTFHPDKNGYVADPRFHKLIKERGYELVSAFYPASSGNNHISYAWFQLPGTWGKIDCNGKVIFMRHWDKDVTDTSSPINLNEDEPNKIFNKVQIEESATTPEEPLYTTAKENGKVGTRDEMGKIGIPFTFDQVLFVRKNLFIVKLADKVGLYAGNGKEIIPAMYDRVGPLIYHGMFRDDIFIVIQNKKWGMVNNKNEFVLPILYDQITSAEISMNTLIVARDGKWGLVDSKGKEITKPVYSNIDDFEEYETTIVKERDSSDHVWYGIIDTAGREMVKPMYDKIQRFNTNLVIITVGKVNESKDGLMEKKTGKVILQPSYSHILMPVKNMAVVVNTGDVYKNGLIDTTGKELVKPLYDDIGYFLPEGIAKIKQDGKYGVIDSNENFILKPLYDRLEISNLKKLILVRQGNKSAAFDHKGNLVIAFTPNYFDNNNENSSVVVYTDINTGKKGVIDKQGKILIKAAYEGINEIEHWDGFSVKEDGKYGVISKEGKLIIRALYDRSIDMSSAHKAIFFAKKEGKGCYIDMYGDEYFRE